jgi:hypothetical protein
MNLLPHILDSLRRTSCAAGRTRKQKPRLEDLEGRALLSASPATLSYGGGPPAVVSSHSTAIVAVADSSQGAVIPVLSLNSIHGGHAHGGIVHIKQVRHALA